MNVRSLPALRPQSRSPRPQTLSRAQRTGPVWGILHAIAVPLDRPLELAW